MKKELLTDEQNEAIVKALDYAIQNGPWEKSKFLQSIGNHLNEIRDNFVKKVNARSAAEVQAETYLANRLALRSGQTEVYVPLYSSDGSNLQSWERILANLPRQMISRPIYADEEHVKALLKTKDNKINEAYVGIFINSTDILALPPDKILKDRLGNSLLSLKDKSINTENISNFVHLSGAYQYRRGRLIKE